MEKKTRSIEKIEEKMEGLDEESLRRQVLEKAKSFKTSWIDLGQMLYTVWKDKLYKEWGYSAFEIYTAKEIGIKKLTALKLLRSYSFLEKEEPKLVSQEYREEARPAAVPSYEAVDTLRLASRKKGIEKSDYERLKRNVLENGKDAKDVKQELTALIKQREELDPDEAFQKKRAALLKRLVGGLRAVKEEIRILKLLPAQVVKEVETLIERIESEAR